MTHGAMTLTCSVRKRVKAGVTADLARHFARYVGGDEDEDKRQHDGNEGLKEDPRPRGCCGNRIGSAYSKKRWL